MQGTKAFVHAIRAGKVGLKPSEIIDQKKPCKATHTPHLNRPASPFHTRYETFTHREYTALAAAYYKGRKSKTKNPPRSTDREYVRE